MPGRLQVTALLLCLCCASVAFTQQTIIEVDATGVPDALSKGDGVHYFLWYDAEGWHLRTDSGGKAHVYTGLITVDGGKFSSVSDFENLEARPSKKKKKNRDPDLGKVNSAKDEITFRFTTSKKHDGFDFQVDENAKSIRFKLMIDGKAVPERVILGAASSPAPSEVFSLPARPE